MTEVDDLLPADPADPARRRGLGATAAWMMLASLGAGRAQAGRTGTTPALAFTPVPMTVEAPLAVPPGYTARVLYAWGDATGQAVTRTVAKDQARHDHAVPDDVRARARARSAATHRAKLTK